MMLPKSALAIAAKRNAAIAEHAAKIPRLRQTTEANNAEAARMAAEACLQDGEEELQEDEEVEDTAGEEEEHAEATLAPRYVRTEEVVSEEEEVVSEEEEVEEGRADRGTWNTGLLLRTKQTARFCTPGAAPRMEVDYEKKRQRAAAAYQASRPRTRAVTQEEEEEADDEEDLDSDTDSDATQPYSNEEEEEACLQRECAALQEDAEVCPPRPESRGDWYGTATSRLARMYRHAGTSDATRLSTPGAAAAVANEVVAEEEDGEEEVEEEEEAEDTWVDWYPCALPVLPSYRPRLIGCPPPPWDRGMAPSQVEWSREVNVYTRSNCGTRAPRAAEVSLHRATDNWAAEITLQRSWRAEIEVKRGVITPAQADAAATVLCSISSTTQQYFLLDCGVNQANPALRLVEAAVLRTLGRPGARVALAYALLQVQGDGPTWRPGLVDRMHPHPQRDHARAGTCSHHCVLLRHTGERTGVWGAKHPKGQLLRYPSQAGGAISCPAGALHCPAVPDSKEYASIKVAYLLSTSHLAVEDPRRDRWTHVY